LFFKFDTVEDLDHFDLKIKNIDSHLPLNWRLLIAQAGHPLAASRNTLLLHAKTKWWTANATAKAMAIMDNFLIFN
jgi:hypothetical protein